MPRDYATAPPNDVRRKDRAMDDEWIRGFLHREPYGALATVHEGRPFVNTNLFVFDEERHAIYFHTARVGRTRANVDAGRDDGPAQACFSVSTMGRLLPAEEALEFSVEYEGVTVFGPISVVDDAEEAEDALQQLLDKAAPHLRPGRDYRRITAGELQRTAVFRLDVESWSGKKKEAPADFPGAFVYAEGGGEETGPAGA